MIPAKLPHPQQNGTSMEKSVTLYLVTTNRYSFPWASSTKFNCYCWSLSTTVYWFEALYCSKTFRMGDKVWKSHPVAWQCTTTHCKTSKIYIGNTWVIVRSFICHHTLRTSGHRITTCSGGWHMDSLSSSLEIRKMSKNSLMPGLNRNKITFSIVVFISCPNIGKMLLTMKTTYFT